MVVYLSAVWRCRYFWLSLVKMDLRSRYRGSALGIGWSLLQPIAMTVILCTVFGQLFNANLHEYAPLVMSGITFWGFVTTCTVTGCQCFFQGEGYIRQYPAPMAIYPLRTMLGASFHFSVALSMVAVLNGVLNGYASVWPLLSLLPTFGLMMVFGWALATLFGLVNVRFRDTHHLSEIGLQILFYVTPVMYPPELLANRRVGWVMDFNPIVPFLNLLREPLSTKSHVPGLTTYLLAALITTALATAASFALKSQERKLIFHL
jgi:ABC-type polysaccharide/polyol phosphate export permease